MHANRAVSYKSSDSEHKQPGAIEFLMDITWEVKMKILRCRDIGERTCNYQVEGVSTEEVERKMLDHTAEKHWWIIESLDNDERNDFLKQMDAMIENR